MPANRHVLPNQLKDGSGFVWKNAKNRVFWRFYQLRNCGFQIGVHWSGVENTSVYNVFLKSFQKYIVSARILDPLPMYINLTATVSELVKTPKNAIFGVFPDKTGAVL